LLLRVANEANRVADVLALTANSANTNVEQLGDAFKFVGPVAAAFGVSIEDTAAALGTLGNAGLQASLAGTGLRKILSTLGTPTKKLNDLLKKLGLTFSQVNPDTNKFADVMQLLADRGIGATDALNVFGQRGAPAILAVTSQIGKLQELTDGMKDVAGTADTTAKILTDTLGGSLKELRSAFEELILSTGDDGLGENLRAIVQGFTGVIRALNGTLDPLNENAKLYEQIAAGVRALKFVLIALIAVRTLSFFGGIIATLGTLTTTFATAAVGVTGFARAMIGLRTIVLGALGPVGWIVGIGLALLAFAQDDAPQAVDALKLVTREVNSLRKEFEAASLAAVDIRIGDAERRNELIDENVRRIKEEIKANKELLKQAGQGTFGQGFEIKAREDELKEELRGLQIVKDINVAQLAELADIRVEADKRRIAQEEQTLEALKKLQQQQLQAELAAGRAQINLNEAIALDELETAQKLAKDIAIIRKGELDKSLAERTISIDEYYDGLEALALEALDTDLAIERQKQAALTELQNQQRDVLQERTVKKVGDEVEGSDEQAAVAGRFKAEQEAQEIRFKQEQLALDQQLTILQAKRDGAIAKNEAARAKASAKQLDADIKAFDDEFDAKEAAQKQAFDDEFDAIILQRDRLSAAAERDVESGAASSFGLGAALDEIDEDAIQKLTDLQERVQLFSDTTTDPILPEKIAAIGDAIVDMSLRSSESIRAVITQLGEGLGDALFDILEGTKSAKEAFSDFARSFLRSIAKMILQQIALNAVKAAGRAFGFGFSGGGAVHAKGGGSIQGFAEGGYITGKGGPTSDTINARLSDGEYVVNAAAVKGYGLNFMEAINRMKVDKPAGLPKFAITRPRKVAFADGGVVDSGAQTNESKAPASSLRIVNVVDTDQTSDYLSSADGEAMIVNIIRRNGSTIKSII